MFIVLKSLPTEYLNNIRYDLLKLLLFEYSVHFNTCIGTINNIKRKLYNYKFSDLIVK